MIVRSLVMSVGIWLSYGKNLLVYFFRPVRISFGRVWQVYWVGAYIGSTVGSVIYQLAEFVEDYTERRRPQEDKNIELHTGMSSCYVGVCLSREYTEM